ncbi:hypothetical protein ES703_09114 [subsurface metagenome]
MTKCALPSLKFSKDFYPCLTSEADGMCIQERCPKFPDCVKEAKLVAEKWNEGRN